MKTNNFKMSFEVVDSHRFTKYTFGYTQVYIYLLEGTLCEQFRLVYMNQGVIKLSVESTDLPDFLRMPLQQLFYGFLNYSYVGYKSPAFQVIGVVRGLRNYCNRFGKPLIQK